MFDLRSDMSTFANVCENMCRNFKASKSKSTQHTALEVYGSVYLEWNMVTLQGQPTILTSIQGKLIWYKYMSSF